MTIVVLLVVAGLLATLWVESGAEEKIFFMAILFALWAALVWLSLTCAVAWVCA